jgi:carotenoid cleavage dioxygenase-like enzyme
VIKVEVDTKRVSVCARESVNHVCGEPVFVGRPGATEEDDGECAHADTYTHVCAGVLLSVVMDGADDAHPYMQVIDARTMTELARAHTPTHVTFGFHAIFMPHTKA